MRSPPASALAGRADIAGLAADTDGLDGTSGAAGAFFGGARARRRGRRSRPMTAPPVAARPVRHRPDRHQRQRLADHPRRAVKAASMSEWTIGIIGGSGLYEIDALEEAQWIAVDTPWGAPSDELLIGRIEGVQFVFLPRHGRGHRIPPSQLNARANIDALKRAGCTDLVAISAIGSLREELAPGRFVVVDQFIDRTFARESELLRPRPRRPCLDGRSGLPAPLRAGRRRGRGGGRRR